MTIAANLPTAAIAAQVEAIVRDTPICDIHTHLYDPAFGDLLLWGIDDLLTYHYLVAETFRYLDVPSEKYWALPKVRQAELVWDALFVRHSPISEACRGVVTTLQALGLEPRQRDLPALRQWFGQWQPRDYLERCLELAGVETVCMTNSPFDEAERAVWDKGFERDERFQGALRIDPLLLEWPAAAARLAQWGYNVTDDLTASTFSQVRRFLGDWTARIRARYLMVSLSPDFAFPGADPCARLLEHAILPHCREFGIPLALMIGVKRQVNPQLRLAGDGVGLSQLSAIEHLCAAFGENRFLVTALARENQYELCVLARKFRNLHVFGCWWFNNVPSLVEEITRMRVELIGLSVTPQHSDARVLDQLIYKWRHFRTVLTRVLVEKYADLAAAGWVVTEAELRRDVTALLGGEFRRFCGEPLNS
jgi:hypothetical protein